MFSIQKKNKKEYVVLVLAWLFWALAEAVSWKYYDHKTPYPKVVFVIFIQFIVAIFFNLVLIKAFVIVQKKKFNNQNTTYTLYTFLVIVFSIIIVLCNSSFFAFYINVNTPILNIHNLLINVLQKNIYLTGFTTLFFMIRNLKELQYQKNEAMAAQKLAAESQLQLLQQQINPHFLFNTLNSLRSLINSDTQKARKMVNYISEFLRESLLTNNLTTKFISEEIKVLDNYLNIQKIRWGNELMVKKEISKDLLELKIPSLILQSLAENAIKHGMISNEILTIKVRIKKECNTLFISIINNGKLAQLNKKEKGGNYNIIKRLDLLYGKDASFEVKELDNNVYSNIIIKNIAIEN